MENQDMGSTITFKVKEDGKVVTISRKEIIDLLRELQGVRKKIGWLLDKAE